MAVAFDASSSLGTGSGDRNFTHTPVGTPRGVVVLIEADEGTDTNPSVTYGGTSMTEVTASPKLRNLGDLHAMYGFLLGASVPTGASTVAISRGGAGGVYHAACYTVTASADTEEAHSNGGNNANANPSTSLTVARTSFVAGTIGSDSAAASAIGPGTLLDTQTVEVDHGVQVGGTYRASALQTGTFSADWVDAATGHAFLAVAIQEVAGAGSLVVPRRSHKHLIRTR